MDMKEIYKFSYDGEEKLIQYDEETATVKYVTKATEEEVADNLEWQKKFGKDLWDIDEDGYMEIARVGLTRESWRNKGLRDEYLSEWFWELDEAVAYEVMFL